MKPKMKKVLYAAGIVAVVLLILNVLLGVIFILLTGVLVALLYVLRWLLEELAYVDKFVTFRTEGEIKAIMKGNKRDRYVMAVENYRIDPDDSDVFKGSNEQYSKELLLTAEQKRAEDPGFVDHKLQEVKPNDSEDLAKFQKRIHYEFGQNAVTLAEKPDLNNAKNTWWVLKPSFVTKLNNANNPDQFERWFGVVWVGFPPYRIFKYQFRWLKHGQEKAKNGVASEVFGMSPRDEEVDSLYFRYTNYGIRANNFPTGAGMFSELIEKLKGTKTSPTTQTVAGGQQSQGGEKEQEHSRVSIQVNLEIVIETITHNPQKTLFRTAGLSSAGDWLDTLTREVLQQGRSWVGTVDYDYLNTNKEDVQRDLNHIRDLINNFDPKTKKRKFPERSVSAVLDYGQEIFSIRLVRVSASDAKIQEAVEKIYAAEQDIRLAQKQKQATVIRAEAKRAEEAAPLLAQADGFAKQKDVLGREGLVQQLVAQEVGKLRGVYAPGGGGNFLFNVKAGEEELGTAKQKEGEAS